MALANELRRTVSSRISVFISQFYCFFQKTIPRFKRSCERRIRFYSFQFDQTWSFYFWSPSISGHLLKIHRCLAQGITTFHLPWREQFDTIFILKCLRFKRPIVQLINNSRSFPRSPDVRPAPTCRPGHRIKFPLLFASSLSPCC